MQLVTYRHEGRRQLGRVVADASGVRSVQGLAIDAEAGALALIESRARGEAMPGDRGSPLPLAAVQIEAPIPRPRRNLFCVGRNYHAHAKELRASVFRDNNADPNAWPIVFSKVPETVVAPGTPVWLPVGVSNQVDYEAELALIIGCGGRNITRANAMRHVFGYTIVNDVTARDVQMRHQQWLLGKSFDTFCPMGPVIVTADELDGSDTRVRCWVNDELRQDASTRDLIFDLPTLIETCSRGIRLEPGDIIATGTPAGVGMGFEPPRWLRAGDVVRIEIDGIGSLQNPFADHPGDTPNRQEIP